MLYPIEKSFNCFWPQQIIDAPPTTLRLPSPRDVFGLSRARPLNAATHRSTPSRAGFEELGIDWGPASPFGPDDDPGTPMTHQDSSESDELRPDLFAPGAAPLPAPDGVEDNVHDDSARTRRKILISTQPLAERLVVGTFQ